MTTYWFGPLLVVDPAQGGLLVPDADFEVFAFADTALTTPLTVQTLVGDSLASVATLHSTYESLLDEFSVEDQPRVWAKSGPHVILLTSTQGLADAADSSRSAAIAAQAAAEAAADAAATALAPTTSQINTYLGGDAAGLVVTVTGKADLDPETGKVVETQLPALSASMTDATAGAKGAVRLSGDLSGTADAPTVPGLADRAHDSAVVKLTGNQTVGGVKTFTASPVVPDGSFTTAKLSATGTADSTRYLRGDGAWVTPSGVTAWVLEGAGIDATGATDCTTALRQRFADGLAAGVKRFVGLNGATYKVAIPNSQSLATFTNTADITVDMSNSTIDNSATSYTADTITPIFLIDGATGTTILVGRYIGFTLPTPGTHLGYRGATLVRAINAAKGVTVRARIDNARYGVQSGEYGDAAKGGCSNFDLTIAGSMVGYPIALYRAEGVRHEIDVDGIHRAAYIAGCNDVRGVARWKDAHIADTAYLITDCLVSGTDAAAQVAPPASPTTSRGCTNVDVTSIDKGSTVFQPSLSCAGITLSRVDACQFRNIKVKVYSQGTDTVSTPVGAFRIASSAKSVQTRYPFNWEPSIVLENIEVSGVVDHSAATLSGNSGSELYVMTQDTTHAATMRGFGVKGLTILPSSASNPRTSWFYAPGLATPARFDHLHTPGLGFNIQTNSTVDTIFERCTFENLDYGVVTGGSRVTLGPGTKISKLTTTNPLSNTFVDGGRLGGAGAAIKQREVSLSLTGASTTWAAGVPAGSIVLGMTGYVQASITGATGYQVGVSGDASRWVNTNSIAAGSAFGVSSQAATEVSPKFYLGSADIIATAKTANFTGGTLRLVLLYIEISTATA